MEEEGAEASLNVFSTNSNAQSNGMVCVVFVSDLVRASDNLEKKSLECVAFLLKLRECCLLRKVVYRKEGPWQTLLHPFNIWMDIDI